MIKNCCSAFHSNHAVPVACVGLCPNKCIFFCKEGILKKREQEFRGNKAAFLEIFLSNMFVPACSVIMYRKI